MFIAREVLEEFWEARLPDCLALEALFRGGKLCNCTTICGWSFWYDFGFNISFFTSTQTWMTVSYLSKKYILFKGVKLGRYTVSVLWREEGYTATLGLLNIKKNCVRIFYIWKKSKIFGQLITKSFTSTAQDRPGLWNT